tara:strand:- start:228 stop:470 length:243 start_codon:yes stop_codon:yes gene_type:complete
MKQDYPVPPGLKRQALCVLNELQAARDLATRLDKDPDSIVEPYLLELLKLCRDEAAMEQYRQESAELQAFSLISPTNQEN